MRTREKFFFLKRTVITVACLSLFFVRIPDAQAAVRTWDGGGGADTNWGTCANWSGDTCPTSADIATFDGTSTNNVTIATTLTGSTAPAGIDINAGYTGIITVNSGVSVSVGSTGYDQADGIFTGGDSAITINGTFTLSAGTFTSTSGTLTVSSTFTHTAGGTFTHNNGTVEFTGSNVTYDFATSETFYNLTLNPSSIVTKTIATGDTLIVANTFICTEGKFGTGTLELRGNATFSSGCDGMSSPMTVTGTGDQTLTDSTNATFSAVTINKASGNVYLGANWDSNSNTFTLTAGTLYLRDSGATTNYSFNVSTYSQGGGTFNGGSSTVTINNTFTLSGGTYNATTGTTTVDSAFTHTAGGTFTHNNGTVEFTGSNVTYDFATSETFYNLTLNPSSATTKTIATGDTLIVANTFICTEGKFGTGTLELRGNATFSSGCDGMSSPMTVTGTGDQTLTDSTNATFSAVTINKASGNVYLGANWDSNSNTFTLTAGTLYLRDSGATTNYSFNVSAYSQGGGTFNGGSSTVTINSTFTLSGGTYNATTGTTTVDSTFTHTAGGTFTHNNGTVTFTGGNVTYDVATSETFYNLTLTASSTAVKTITSGDTFIVTGTYTANEGGFGTGTLELRGNATWASTADTNSALVTFTGTGDQIVTLTPTGKLTGGVTVNKASGNVYLGADWNNNSGTFTMTAGTWYQRNEANSANYSFTVNAFAQGGGTFHGGTAAATYNGTFTITAGTHNATTGTATYESTWTHTAGGTFNHNSGTTAFTSGSTTIDVATSETFGAMTINKSNTAVLTIATGDTITATGTLTLTEGKWGTGTLAAQGDVTAGASFDNNGTADFKFTGSATQAWTMTTIAKLSAGDIYVNKSGGQVNLGSTLTMNSNNNDFIIQEGTFDLNGNNMSVTAGATETFIVETGGNLQLQGGETITGDSASYPQLDSGSTVTYDGTSGPYTMKDYTYHHLTINGGASSVFTQAANESYGGNVTITQGILSQGGFTTTVTGTFANSGTLRRLQIESFTGTMDVDSGTVEYAGDGDAQETVTITDFNVAGTDYYNLKINDANVTTDIFAIGTGLTVAGTLQVTSAEFTQGANAITTAALTVDGGTFTGGSAAVTVSGALTLSSGVLTATTNTTTVTGAFTHTAGGTFTHNSGTVAFTGSAATVDVATSETFSALTINKTDGQTLTITSGDTLTATGVLTLTNGAWGTGGLVAQGNIVVGSGWDAAGSSTLTISGSGTQTLDLSAAAGALDNPVIINKAGGSFTFASAVTLDATGADWTLTNGTVSTGNFTLTTSTGSDIAVNGGTLSAGSSTMTIAGALTVAGGTYNGNTSSGTISGAFLISSGAYNGNTSTPTFSGGVTISGGTFTASSGTTTVSGGFTHTAGGTFTHNSGTVAFTGNSATADVATTETFSALTINKTDGQTLTVASGDTLIATGTLTLTDGTWGTGSVQAQGNVTVPSTWDAGGSGTLEFAGSAAQSFDLTGAVAAFDNPVNVNKSGDTLTLASAYTLDHANADFTVTLGTFSTGNFAMTTSSGSDIAINGGIFNAGSSTMTLAGTVTVAGGTYNGNTSSGTISGAFALSSGAYNGNTSTPTFSGGLTISGGTFTASSGTTTVSGGWTHTAGGTFTHNSGTVAFTGNAATVDVTTTETFSGLTVNKTDGQTLTIASGDTLIATATLTLTDGTWGTGSVQAQGNVSVPITWDAGGSGTLEFAGTGTQTFDLTGATAAFDNPVNINKSGGSLTLASAYTLDHANADFTVTLGTFSTGNYAMTTSSGSDIVVNGGIFNAGSSTMTIAGLLTVSSGTYNANTSTPTYSNTVTVSGGTYNGNTSTPSFNGAFLISSGAYNGSANGDTFAGGFTISGGTFTASDATTTVSSTWTHTAGGTFTHNSGTVAMTGAASTIDVATSETFSSLTINKNNAATLTITSGDSLISVGTLTLTNGAVGTGTLRPQGAVSVGAGFDGGNAPMTFAGSAAQTFTLTGATDKFDGDITVNKSSETVSLGSALVMDASGQDLTVTLGTFSTTGTNYAVTVAGNVAVNGGTLTLNGSTVDINGDLTIGGGTLNMGSATITIAGGVTYTSGTMTPGTSSVTLDGTSQTLAGATTWNNLTKIVTTAATLTLPAGATTTISGTMNFQGAVSQLLSLRSSSTGTQTTLSPALVTTPYYLDVKDNVITKSTSCITSTQGCVNSSNNSGWTFTTSSDDDVSNSNSPENIWIRVTAPNGGETYVVGSTVQITWDSSGAIHRVNIAFSPDAGDTWTALASSVMNVNAYTWTIDGSHTTDGMIRVEAFDGLTAYRTDTSDDVFAITGESDSTETEEVTDVPIVSTDPIVQARVEALPTSVAVHGLVKLADDGNPETQADSAVYYIGADGYRHAFPNQAVFLSWFVDFSQVQIISASDLSSMAFGPNITYRPGVRMVKFLSSAKTYAVDAFGELRWIETEAIAAALYGEHWTTFIDDISDAFFGNYTIGRPIDHPSAFDPEAETARTVYPSDSIVIPGYND